MATYGPNPKAQISLDRQNTNCMQWWSNFYKISKKKKVRKASTVGSSMAKIRFTAAPILILVLLTGTAPAPIHSLSVSNYRTFFSLSHSLLMRVSNLRAERGDISGANRAKAISQKLQRGAQLWLDCWGLAFSLGWDYVKNYAWRELDYRELYDAVSDLNELSSILSESMNSDIDRVAWVGRNYGKILATSKRLSARLLNVFRRSVRFSVSGSSSSSSFIRGEITIFPF